MNNAERIASDLHDLSDIEKLKLIELLARDLDKPDPEIDRIWATEARKRWDAYKAGNLTTISYQSLMSKYQNS